MTHKRNLSKNSTPDGFSLREFTAQVNVAFKKYHSILDLALSKLAAPEIGLINPLLVLDTALPTADERGHGLRLLLQWAVGRLAPGSIEYPLGDYRPFDDPTWIDPAWWHYNILRHRYLDPLHPDDFVEGGRFTETLMHLTGIPTSDTYFDERNRAIREVAERLYEQRNTLNASAELQQLALAEVYETLRAQPDMQDLLGIAATFDDAVFPQTLLLQIADQEQLHEPIRALDRLIAQRLLRTTVDNSNLRVSAILQSYIYNRQLASSLLERHRQIACYYKNEQEPLRAAYHFQKAQQWEYAASILLEDSDELLHDIESTELTTLLRQFKTEHLSTVRWREVQILLSDLLRKEGAQTEAVAACEQALKAIDETTHRTHQARIYRRLGKLYEQYNHQRALSYYQEAVTHFTSDAPELLDLLKDRAWVYIFQDEWQKAENDLEFALTKNPEMVQMANIYDAFAGLYRRQKKFNTAIDYAKQGLRMRERIGDPLRVADSYNNLGLIYNNMGEYTEALLAHETALHAYHQLRNRNLVATEAIRFYKDSLNICKERGLPLIEVTNHSNLAEALADLNRASEARKHWLMGYRLSFASEFDEQVKYFEELRESIPLLQGDEIALPKNRPSVTAELDPDEKAALEIVQRTGRITPKVLMDAISVSKATATRRLANLVQSGHLEKRGQGRGTYYASPNDTDFTSINLGHDQSTVEQPDAQHDRLRQILEQQRHTLTERYPVAALGVISQERYVQQMLVRFDETPDLQIFFELEKELTALLDFHVDLVLEDNLGLGPPSDLDGNVAWAWRETQNDNN